MSLYFIDSKADDMELEGVAAAIDEAGYGVGALRIRQALSEIARLRAALQKIASTPGYGTDGPSSAAWEHWQTQARRAQDA